MSLDALMAAAMNPLHPNDQRLASYRAHEAEKWFLAVLSGGLKISDLERKWQEPVKALIVQHANNMK